jgi:hypothetical protein
VGRLVLNHTDGKKVFPWVPLILICDVDEVNRFFIHDIDSVGNPRTLLTSNRNFHDSVSKVLEKSILKKTDDM